MSSKVTAPEPDEQGLTLAAPRWHGSLHDKWREQPEQFAWLVILISFTIFAVLAFAIPMGVNYTIRYLPISQSARFEPAGESVWLLYVPKASETIAVTTPRDNIRAGDSIVATGDATQGTLNLVSDEEAADNQVLGSLHIYSGTKVEVLRLSRPFFKNWSNEPYQARLRLDVGQARIFTNSGNARPLSVQLETPHGTVQLASGSYQISVEEQQTDITVVSGQATLWREVDKDQRVTVYCHDIPRTRKTLGFGGLVSLFVETFFASSDNGQNFFAREIYFANCVIFRVAQIQKVIALAKNVADALRVVELGL